MLALLPLSTLLITSTLASSLTSNTKSPQPLPLIIWHGLGDNYAADGLRSVGELANATNPGTYTYYIHLGDDPSDDRTATFLGNLTEQIDTVCATLATHPVLSRAPALNALGFSQGGQFLRALVQRCGHAIRIRNLVTFGSQHNGITQYQTCESTDWLCRSYVGLLKSNTWSGWVQSHLVPAQYFKATRVHGDDSESESHSHSHSHSQSQSANANDNANDNANARTDKPGWDTDTPSADYLAHSNFLADINNERADKNASYARNLARLRNLVLFLFDADTTVIPKESGWFAYKNATDGVVTGLHSRQIYTEDWIGLRRLDEKGGLHFESTPGAHMHLDDRVLTRVFEKWFAPEAEGEQGEEVMEL